MRQYSILSNNIEIAVISATNPAEALDKFTFKTGAARLYLKAKLKLN